MSTYLDKKCIQKSEIIIIIITYFDKNVYRNLNLLLLLLLLSGISAHPRGGVRQMQKRASLVEAQGYQRFPLSKPVVG